VDTSRMSSRPDLPFLAMAYLREDGTYGMGTAGLASP